MIRIKLLSLFSSWLMISVSGFLVAPNRPHSVPTSRLFAECQATFGMGCFWEPSESLLEVDGVIDTVAGYTGNPKATKPPNYESVCYSREWVEAVRVTYDDEELSYTKLLDAFFENQKPQGSRQYASMIFYSNDEERKMAEEWKDQDKARPDGFRSSYTALEPTSPFYQAEGYHQRFWQKQRPRIAFGILLIAVASGILNPVVPEEFQEAVKTAGNAGYIVGVIALLLERKIDTKVVELP